MTGFFVVGFRRDEDHPGDRAEAATEEEAARAVAAMLRAGYAWIHVDNLAELSPAQD